MTPRRGVAPRFVLATAAMAALLLISGPSRAQDARPLVSVSAGHSAGLPVLEARPSDGGWTTACPALPCELRLSVADEYRIAGEGVVDSDVFRLPRADSVHVDATGGSSLLHGMGTFLTVGGLVFVAGGGAILLVPDDAHATSDAKTSKTIVGVGFIAMGLVGAAVGILARVFSDTSVRVSVAQ